MFSSQPSNNATAPLPATEPTAPKRWWGVPEAEWFRTEQGEAPRGHHFDEVSVAAGRFRIPPREIEEMLPQQALALAVAADAFDGVKPPHPRPLSHRGERGDGRERTGAYVGVSLDLNTTNFHLRWSLLKLDPDLAELAGPARNANRVMGALATQDGRMERLRDRGAACRAGAFRRMGVTVRPALWLPRAVEGRPGRDRRSPSSWIYLSAMSVGCCVTPGVRSSAVASLPRPPPSSYESERAKRARSGTR